MRSGDEGENGCTFTVDLPVAHFRQVPERRLSNVETLAEACGISLEQLEACRPRVLVVDDSALNRKMLLRLFAEHCEVCSEAANGHQALEIIAESMRPGAVGYDGVIMDFCMPVMNGPDAVRKLRASGFEGRIIGLTGNGLQADTEMFINAGVEKVLLKPVGFNQLREIIPGTEFF